MPTMMNALIAVLNASGEPSAIMPNVVPSSPSQKKSSTTRWSASTMPLAIASEMSRYAQKSAGRFRSRMNRQQ